MEHPELEREPVLREQQMEGARSMAEQDTVPGLLREALVSEVGAQGEGVSDP